MDEQPDDFSYDLGRLREAVSRVNRAFAQIHNKHPDYEISAFVRIREDEPKELDVVVRQVFAHIR